MIPDHVRESLLAYWHDRRPPGGFCEAVLENDLTQAVFRADEENLKHLADTVCWVYQNLPWNVSGSKQKVQVHLKGSNP